MGSTLAKEWEAHGMLCRATSHSRSKNYCGYVRVLKGHPFYEVKYGQAVAVDINKARMKDTIGDLPFGAVIAMLGGKLRTPDSFVRVHGGITYSEKRHPADKKTQPGCWWFGWDTGHAGDYCPYADLSSLKSRIEIGRGYPSLHHPESLDELAAYVSRVEAGEVSRDFVCEARLLKKHYWTLEEITVETEKAAEQLAMIGLLGVKKHDAV